MELLSFTHSFILKCLIIKLGKFLDSICINPITSFRNAGRGCCDHIQLTNRKTKAKRDHMHCP